MGTRSNIIVQLAADKWARIYCHWDGYPSHNGAILLQHYATDEAARKLIALGSLSILAPSTDKPEGHTFNSPVRGYCVAYGRDRGEKGTKATRHATLQEAWEENGGIEEYAYVKRIGEGWRVSEDSPERLRVLTPQECEIPGAEPLPVLEDIAREMLAWEAEQFDGPPDTDLSVSGADLVDAFTAWRVQLKAALGVAS